MGRVKWESALPEANVRSRAQREGGCFAGTKVPPSASLAWRHGEGVAQHGPTGEADDTSPITRFETSPFHSC